MKEFPNKLQPKYKHLFQQIKFNHELENWREKLFEYIVSGNKDGFDLTHNNKNIDKRIINCLCFELNNLGWKTNLAFGSSVLFIYENDSDIEKYKYSFDEHSQV
jgi:hypothetical protein